MNVNMKCGAFKYLVYFFSLSVALSISIVVSMFLAPPQNAEGQALSTCLTDGRQIKALPSNLSTPFSASGGSVYDARSWTFNGRTRKDEGVIKFPNRNTCLVGGEILGTFDRNKPWKYFHGTLGDPVTIYTTAANITIDGLRIDNFGGGVWQRPGTSNFDFKNLHFSTIHDDCIEDDSMAGGSIDDSLFDGCYVGFSADHPSLSGGNNTVTITNTLVRLENMPGGHHSSGPTHGALFKWEIDGRSPKLVLKNNIFVVDGPGESNPKKLVPTPVSVIKSECSNNTIVWKGSGSFPTSNPYSQSCLKIINWNNGGQTLWENAKADWLARHSGGTPPTYQCSDSIDNDGDGAIDYPADTGCTSATDNDETNPVPTGKFSVGDRVQTTGNLNVRLTPNGDILGVQSLGAAGTVTGGPRDANGYTWWQIDYDTAPDGWSADAYLEKSTVAAGVDLFVTNVQECGSIAGVCAKLCNAGPDAHTGFPVRLQSNGHTVDATFPAINLSAGQCSLQAWPYSRFAMSNGVQYSVTVTADPNGVVAETNESNNVATANVTAVLGQFSIGDRVRTNSNVDVYSTPGGSVIGTENQFSVGTIIDGPVNTP